MLQVSPHDAAHDAEETHVNYRKSEAKAASKAQFRGVWAAITTPFTPDGEVDEAGLRRNMRHYTDVLHVDGIFCTGTIGEFWALTGEERKRIVEIVVEEARHKCKVIAHTAHHAAKETVELTRHAEEVGADFAVLMNPYYPPADEAMVYDWFKFVASRVNIGIWMFDAEFAGYGFSPQLTARIAEIENVCGIKIPRPMEHYEAVKRLIGDKIVMSQPNEHLSLALMRDHGQRVHMSSPTPYLYQVQGSLPMRDYTEHALQGRFEAAAEIAATLEPVREVYLRWFRNPWVERRLIPIAYVKAWQEMLGMAAGPVRTPLLQMTAKERDALQADLERTGILTRFRGIKAAA